MEEGRGIPGVEVKFVDIGRNEYAASIRRPRVTVPPKEAPANSVPAAAVIRRVQALFGFIGRKARVGGLLSLV